MVDSSPKLLKKLHCDTCKSRAEGIFCALSREQARDLDQSKICHTFKKGQALFYEGQPATGIYCIFSGKIKLYKLGSRGYEQILGIAKAGDVLGYRALFSKNPNSMTAEPLEESSVCYIDRESFLHLVTHNPSVSMNIIKSLSQEIDSVEDRLLDQVDKPVHVRMARLLLMLKETHGRAETSGIRLDVALSRRELAEMIGTTQETAIRLLSQLKKKGVVALDRRSIVVLDSEALLKSARLHS